MDILVRKMLPNDWESVKRIYQQGVDSGNSTFRRSVPPYESWMKSNLPVGRLVAEIEGRIAGWVTISRKSERYAYRGVAEISIYVDQDYKGHGIGTALLNEEIRISEEAGFWTLQSSLMEGNDASLALHKKCGFRVLGVRERIAQDKYGIWRNGILMERRSKIVGIENNT